MLILLGSGHQSQAKPLTRQQAVRAAEKFIAANGYTDLRPMRDTSKLTFESIEWESDRKKILQNRHNTLQRKAYGFIGNSKGVQWVIVFRHKDTQYKETGRKEAGRAVTMDLDGKHKRVQHVDIFLSSCKRL